MRVQRLRLLIVNISLVKEVVNIQVAPKYLHTLFTKDIVLLHP